MDTTDLRQYIDLFMEEMDEQLQIMDDELLHLEQQGESEEGIQSLFRAAHTIKGSSAAMGFEAVKSLTHEMEQVLDGIRSHSIELNSGLINLLFTCLDCLKDLRSNLEVGEGNSLSVDPLIEQLIKAVNPSMEDSDGQSQVVLPKKMQEQQRRQYELNISIVQSCEMKLARCIVIYNKLQEYAQVIKCYPSLEEELEDFRYKNIQMICITPMGASQLEEYILTLMDIETVEVSETAEESPIDTSVIGGKISPDVSPDNPSKRKSQSIRVNVEQIEHLMNLVGELVIDQTRINQVKGNLQRKYHSDEDIEELGHVSDHVNRVVSDLQENIMKARMLPIEHLFNRFPRMVRDLSQSLNKEVELTLTGNETELDRSLIEEIGDPLIHLIRNALDHGIEDSHVREQKGKPVKGRLRIAAAHEDNQVVITLEDDGAGIDAHKMKQTALLKGIISSEEAESLTEHEAINLIFRAGFSTASVVSEVSGRGVGMDIVRSDIERLNGLIDIQTELGKGTLFKIRLPLTLAIITGLLIKIGDRTFILPMGNVAEIVRIDPEEIKTVRGEEVIVNRERVIPLLWLHDRFRIARIQKMMKKIPLVIVGTAEKRIALAVDDLIGNQDIVIKSLGSYIGKAECITGATILGDGRVAFILEVSDILNTRRQFN